MSDYQDNITDDDLTVEGVDDAPVADAEASPAAEAAPAPDAKAEAARQWVKEHSRPGRDGKPYFPDEVFQEIVRPEVEKRMNKYVGMIHERDERLAAMEQELLAQRQWREGIEVKAADADLDQKEQEAKVRLRQARQADDTDGEIAAMEALAEAKARRIAAQRASVEAPRQAPPPQPNTPKAAQEWATRNADWFDGRNEDSQKANAIYHELMQDYNPNSPRLYEELDRRLGRAAAPEKELPRNPPPTAANPRGGRPATGADIRLTKEDLTEMKDIHGLDPNNKQHRADWLAAKRRVAEYA